MDVLSTVLKTGKLWGSKAGSAGNKDSSPFPSPITPCLAGRASGQGRHENVTSKRFPNRANEVRGHPSLCDEPQPSCGQTGVNEVAATMGRQENNRRRAAGPFQTLRSLDSVEKGHGNVGDDDVGLEFQCRVKQCSAVAHFSDNLKS